MKTDDKYFYLEINPGDPMALACEVYEFDGQVPPLEQIEVKVRELVNCEPTREGTLEPSPGDEAEAKALAGKSKELRIRSTHVTFRKSDGVRRGATYVKIIVSMDGTKIVVCGNNMRIFRATSAALASVGGAVYVHKPRKLDR